MSLEDYLDVEITLAPCTGPWVRSTSSTKPEDFNCTTKSIALDSSLARNAQVGPLPEITAPNAPESIPCSSTRPKVGRAAIAAAWRSL